MVPSLNLPDGQHCPLPFAEHTGSKNAIAGLCIIIAIGLLIIVTAFTPLISLMTAGMNLFSTGLALGLIFEIFAILVSVPFFLISILRRT